MPFTPTTLPQLSSGRQSLGKRDITSVIALARKPVSIPENLEDGADPSKLKSVIVEDYEHYPEDVMRLLIMTGTVAITPSKSTTYDSEEVRRICHTSTLAGFKAMHQSAGAERDQAKMLWYMSRYMHLRPGLITAQGYILRNIMGAAILWVLGIPSINVADLAEVMLDQVINGFEKDPLVPEDLVRIAQGILDGKQS
ncbi:NAD(P)-binding protein [Hypoxylon sp. FL1150]|nr:NAD(P)-binding protein [Hypoxylon sp. FL1150]